MKSHRIPETLNEKMKESAGEVLDAEWKSAQQDTGMAKNLNPELRERVLAAARKEKRGHDLRRRFVRYGQCAAMLILTVGVILFCIPTVRAGFVNALVTWYDEYFRLEFNPGTDKSSNDWMDEEWLTEFGYVPDGYTLVDRFDSVLSATRTYKDADGNCLYLHVVSDSAHSLYDDKFILDEVSVGGQPGYYMHHSDFPDVILTWSSGRTVYSVSADSDVISKDELIRIAESLK